MKLETQREQLLTLLQYVIGVVERRQTLPILSNVLVSVEESKLRFTATDLEVELSASDNLLAVEDGQVTLPARKLLDILRALPEGETVSLTAEGAKATLRCGRSRFALATLPVEDFPSLESVDALGSITLRQCDLKSLLDSTQFAMAQQDVRYYLNGLLLEVGDNQLRAVATDGHRLALSDQIAQIKGDVGQQVIVPRKGVQELSRLLTDDDKEVEIKLGSSHIHIVLGTTYFTSKLIDGKFPDYQRAIPVESERILVADRNLLRAALQRTAILSNENKGVRLQLEDWLLRLQANNPEQEEAEEEIEVNYSGGALEIGFNVTYLLDALAALQGELVKIFFNDTSSSCLLREAESESIQYVISPMRL
jgi:DNA polymerase-3 subunit beta